MKDITLLIAHPDDECIFLWAFLPRVKRIVCASNDANNPDRLWCKERGRCLMDVGELLGAQVICFNENSEFYRLRTRNGELKKLAQDIAWVLRDAEIIATHNAWGEYGHLDHLLCNLIGRTVQAETHCELLCTDIAVTDDPAWLPIKRWAQTRISIPGPTEHEIDRPLFDRIKAIYDSRGCWTWSYEPVEHCRVFSL